MNTAPIESNPFALLLDAEAVMARVAASPRLAMLTRRVCRPLDKPLLGSDPIVEDAEDAEDETTPQFADSYGGEQEA